MLITDLSTDVCSSDHSDYFTAQRWGLLEGLIFMPAEEQAGKSVCVIGNTVRTNLFRRDDPIGERIRLKDVSCETIAVLDSRRQSGFVSDQYDAVIMPSKTVQRRSKSSEAHPS